MKTDEQLTSSEKPQDRKPHKLVRFDFPPNTPPEEIVKKLKELREKHKKPE